MLGNVRPFIQDQPGVPGITKGGGIYVNRRKPLRMASNYRKELSVAWSTVRGLKGQRNHTENAGESPLPGNHKGYKMCWIPFGAGCFLGFLSGMLFMGVVEMVKEYREHKRW